MKFRKILVANLLTILFLSLAGNILLSDFGIKAVEVVPDYIPIKWALIVLGGFDYYKDPPVYNAIQKAEHWIQSEGVPYDIIEDDNIETPIDTPASGEYPLQYANGTIRYEVFVVIMNNYEETNATNVNYIYWAVGNGTNTVIFGEAAKCVPELLNITANDVSYFIDYFITTINYSVLKGFSDGIEEFPAGNYNIEFPNYYGIHANVSNTEGKTLWYTCKANSEGEFWNGMMNTTYGSGKVFWHSNIPSTKYFLWYSTFSSYWNAFKIISHSINFMFKQVKRVDLGLQGYKRWGGALTYRLDQDTYMGIEKPPEEALRAGWYVDVVMCALGYLTTGGSLTDGMPDGYTGAPSTKVKHGTWTDLIVSTEPLVQTSRTFIVYNSAVDGDYDRMKTDWNQNKNFTDDRAFEMWENMTSDVTGLMGTYYWGYIDNWENPTWCRLGWLCPLRDRISNFTWWKTWGQQGYIRYGFHGWQHQQIGTEGSANHGVYHQWNGTHFILNQTWIEQKFTEAKNELSYCLGSAAYGFDADKVLVSHPGNEYWAEVDAALFNLDWVYLTYGDTQKNEPGWFLYNDRETAMTCGAGAAMMDKGLTIEALKDAVKTLFPIFGVYEHNAGYYNLTFNVYPPDTAYTDMFCFAHLDESFEFWSNARYMWMNTLNAYYKNNKLILEYKANSTLKDYVWRFPVEFDGKYFNGFSDNRTVGKIKHIDGKYIYIEFSEGGCERLEATYGIKPHIYQTSSYIQNITQIYTSKNLTLQLGNASGSINVKVNCAAFGQPNATKIDGNLIDFEYDSITKICSFNVTLNGLTTVELLWTYAPPDPPTFLSPSVAKRFDPNKSATFSWEFNDPDLDDFQSAYRFQLDDDSSFFSLLIDTGKVSSSSTQTTQTLPNSIGLYYWRIETWDKRNAEGEWSDPQTIIVDRLKVASKGVTLDRTNVGSPVYVYFNVIREYDNTPFDGTKGTVYINDSATTWDETNRYWKLSVTQNSVGRWEYKVSSITDTEHQITTVNDFMETQEVIWDKLMVTITPEATTVTVGTQVKFIVIAVYAYDNESVPEFTTNILRDGKHFAVNNFTDTCSIEFPHLYTTENITEKTYGLTAFTSNSATVTWVPKPLIQQLMDWMTSNALILVPIIQLAIILTYLLIRESRKNKKVQQSCH